MAHSTPHQVPDSTEPLDFALTIDASENRYGAVLIDLYTMHYYSVSREFEFGLKNSVDSEPYALELILEEAEKITRGNNVLVLTDHKPLVDAFNKGFSPHPGYNKCILTARKTNLARRVQLRHIPGQINPANEPSRGLDVIPEKVEHIVQLILREELPGPEPAHPKLRHTGLLPLRRQDSPPVPHERTPQDVQHASKLGEQSALLGKQGLHTNT